MATNHFDVLVIGAGISGIGAAYHLQDACPGKTFAILEGRAAIGGTWDLFRYPGIRSDSDMFTFGYSFRPWESDTAIADGESILAYLRDTVEEFDLSDRIRFEHRVVGARWSSEEAQWTVDVVVGEDGVPARFTAGFLYMCTGYYRYDEGYRPSFVGEEDFAGEVVHPQHWDPTLDYAGKDVVVIGSGATAVTLVPAMAETAGHVTMLQRSPTYIVSRPARHWAARFFHRWLPGAVAHRLTRWTVILEQILYFGYFRRFPNAARRTIMSGAREELGDEYDVDTHLNPSYDPWDQRLCLVPDGDLFRAISAGRASIVTDHVERFVEGGIRLRSGTELAADVVVTATGLQVRLLDGIELLVDGESVDLGDSFSYRGTMLSGLPNFALSTGYTNASWTLKSELISRFVCRLLDHMDEHGYTTCVPRRDPALGDDRQPVIEFSSGYIQRVLDELPSQGSDRPWVVHQNYLRDVADIRLGSLDDGSLIFSGEVRRAGAGTSAG